MRKVRQAHLRIAAMASALFFSGCTPFPKGGTAAVVMDQQNTRVQRESLLQAEWQGRTYQDLIDVFGAPRAVLEMARPQRMKTDIVVYESNDPASRCIDAFVIVDDYDTEPYVKDYFCR